MFKRELAYELKRWLTRWSIYWYAVLFAALAGLIFAGSLGIFDPIPKEVSREVWLNSDTSINYILLYYHKLMLILLPMIVGASLYRDYKKEAHQIIYSFPVRKAAYLLGRLTATLIILFAVSLLVILILMLVEHLDGLNPNLLGPFSIYPYLQTLFLYLIPNWVVFGLSTFAVVMLTRKIIPAYLMVLFPILIQLIAENAFTGNAYLIALADPFGQNVATYYQQDWDIVTQNTRSLTIDPLLIFNRLIWLGFSIFFFLYAYRRFEFLSIIEKKRLHKRPIKAESEDVKSIEDLHLSIPISLDFSYKLWIKALASTARRSFSHVVKNVFFWIICTLGLLSMVFIMLKVTTLEDFILVPATQLLIGSPLIIYSMIIVMVTIIFSGMLIHKESQVGMDQIMETAPIPIYLFALGKFLGIIGVQLFMLLLFAIASIVFQWFSGYHDVNPFLYIDGLFLHALIPLITWALVAFFIHIAIQKLYLSIFFLILGWVGVQGLPTLGIDTYLLRFNELPRLFHSEFNGFGPLESSFYVVAGYWISFGVILFSLSFGIYRMGEEWSFRQRLMQLRVSKRGLFLLTIPAALLVMFGWEITKGEQAKEPAISQETAFKEFKQDFKPFRALTQPKIVALEAVMELYPNSRSFDCKGQYTLVNKSKRAIDTLLIRSGFDEKTTLQLSVPSEIIRKNAYMKTQLIKLESSLFPGDSLQLRFRISSLANTLFERNSSVLKNGTFLQQDIFPRLGYIFDEEMPATTDSSFDPSRHYQSRDADKVVIDLTIGTLDDQIATAPGDLKDTWQTDGRTYFQYQTIPTKFSFGITSATYKRQTLETVVGKLELYYLHDRMLPSMIEGNQSAITFSQNQFGSYPHNTTRIIEFPISEGSFATASCNNLLISEARFLTNASPEDAIDIAYYVSAHETMHHWWGNALAPAYSKGATFITESITEYLMLRLLQLEKGDEAMHAFYAKQKQRYEAGKRSYKKQEPALIHALPEDKFIIYGKGAINLFDLSEVIGADRFHEILAEFLRKYSEMDTYPTSTDFVNYLKAQLGEEKRVWIKKYLEAV